MKILALSDLHWNQDALGISLVEANDIREDKLHYDKFERIQFYFEIIKKEKPDLLLLCGDITGDGSCGHGFSFALIALLKLTERIGIPVRYILGNHDEEDCLSEIQSSFLDSEQIKQITETVEPISNFKIAGLSYQQTKTITSIKKMKQLVNDDIDILICHCDLSKRLHLFDFPTKIVITGHYDLKVMYCNNTLFLSLGNDSPHVNYAVIILKQNSTHVSYRAYESRMPHWNILNYEVSNNELVMTSSNLRSYFDDKDILIPLKQYDNLAYINNLPLQSAIDLVLELKKQGLHIDCNQLNTLTSIRINANNNISKTFLSSYIQINHTQP